MNFCVQGVHPPSAKQHLLLQRQRLLLHHLAMGNQKQRCYHMQGEDGARRLDMLTGSVKISLSAAP